MHSGRSAAKIENIGSGNRTNVLPGECPMNSARSYGRIIGFRNGRETQDPAQPGRLSSHHSVVRLSVRR